MTTKKHSDVSSIADKQKIFKKQYAKQFRKPVSCPDCSGPITPEMAYCPWCGEETDFSKYPGLTCERCNQPVMPGYDCCPWCRYKFGEEGAGRYETAYMDGSKCPECDSAVEPYHHYCPCCDEELDEPNDDHPDECPECQWPIDEMVYCYCPWCGDSICAEEIVHTKSQLEDAVDRKVTQIIVEGELAMQVNKALEIKKYGLAALTALSFAIISIPLTGGISATAAAALSASTGIGLAAIIAASAVGLGLMLAITMGYNKVQVAFDPPSLVLEKF